MVASHATATDRAAHDAEHRLGQLAAARGPLRCIAARLAARLFAQQGWSRLGFARSSDYARERLGVSGRSLQEWARVGARFDEVPVLEAALVSGALPWSKVRLLARFVEPEDAPDWIAYAADRPVSQLRCELRAVDRGAIESGSLALGADDDGDDACDRVRVRVPPQLAFKWQRAKAYAAKVEGSALAAGDVLERVTAEVVSALPVAAADPIDDRRDPPRTQTSPRNGTVDHPRRDRSPTGPAEMPAFLLPLLEGLDHADPFELDARLRRVVRLEQRLGSELGPLLRELTSSEYIWKQRYTTLATLARECLGMAPSKLRALLRIERLGDVCPELRGAYRDGRISWVQAQHLARLFDTHSMGDWRGAWVRFAQTVTVRRLFEAIDHACLLRDVDPMGFIARAAEPDGFGAADAEPVSPERQTCARPTSWIRDIRLQILASKGVARLFRAALCTVRCAIEREAGRLPPESVAFEAMLDHALDSWGVDDAWLRRRIGKTNHAVFERDGWRCVFPGCTAQRNLQVHHIVFRSAGGSNELSNLATLCAFHHQRGVHGGTVAVRGHAPDRLEFDLGLRGGHAPLARFRSGDRVCA